jgi:hypothetical protein
MTGSGTVLRVAAEQGHHCIGFDMDPLAVLMARVWTTPVDVQALKSTAKRIADRASAYDLRSVRLPWIDADPETRDFIAYWFDDKQRRDLRRLAFALHPISGPIADALRLALSRLIITKDRGASLARDVSHSRPHRVCNTNDFPVMDEFLRSAGRLAERLSDCPPPGQVKIRVGDARHLGSVAHESVDAVITSPPYLNAIDYIRGHRLSLVWLGHSVGELRRVRANSIGTERAPAANTDVSCAATLTSRLKTLAELPPRIHRMVQRYTLDLLAMATELHRVLRPGGKAVLVVGNSCLRGIFVENALVVTAVANHVGFRLVSRSERELPPSRRYLPPPSETGDSVLQKRMRTETVLGFVRSPGKED